MGKFALIMKKDLDDNEMKTLQEELRQPMDSKSFCVYMLYYQHLDYKILNPAVKRMLTDHVDGFRQELIKRINYFMVDVMNESPIAHKGELSARNYLQSAINAATLSISNSALQTFSLNFFLRDVFGAMFEDPQTSHGTGALIVSIIFNSTELLSLAKQVYYKTPSVWLKQYNALEFESVEVQGKYMKMDELATMLGHAECAALIQSFLIEAPSPATGARLSLITPASASSSSSGNTKPKPGQPG